MMHINKIMLYSLNLYRKLTEKIWTVNCALKSTLIYYKTAYALRNTFTVKMNLQVCVIIVWLTMKTRLRFISFQKSPSLFI